MAYRPARPGSEGNTRLLKAYGGGSKPPRQHYATGGAVKGENPSLDEGMEAAPIADLGDEKPSKSKKDKGDKKDAKTSINIVVMPKADAAPPMPPPGAAGMSPPPPMPMPPMPPPGAGPGGPPMPPMRASGGRVSSKDQATKHDVTGTSYAKGGKVHSDAAMDKKAVKRAVHRHEAGMHPGKPMTKLAKGGPAKEPTTKSMLSEKGFQGGGGGAMGRLEKIRAYGKK